MPPQMEASSRLRRGSHRLADAAQTQPFQTLPLGTVGAQETAGGQVPEAAQWRRGKSEIAGKAEIGVQELSEAAQFGLLFAVRSRAIHPMGRISAERGKAQFGACGEVVRPPLVARKDKAHRAHAEPRTGGYRRFQVRSKIFLRLSRLETVIVRERVACEFHSFLLQNSLRERQ